MADENQQQVQPNSGEQSERDSPQPSFRERTMQRLGSDYAPEANDGTRSVETEEVITKDEAVQDDAHQSDDGYPDDLPLSDDVSEQTTEDDVSDEVDTNDVEDVLPEQDLTELRQRADEAESLVESMQSDYTRKTQKLGESRRDLAARLEQSERIASAYTERASQAAAQYENVNWQQLQSTLDPATYSQRVEEYRQVIAIRDRAHNEHQAIAKFAGEQIEQVKKDEADISRDILRTTVPNWGNDLYGTLRGHAIERLDFAADEFDQITDHRVIKLIHNSWKISQSGKRIENIQHNGSRNRQPSGNPNKERPRGADGKFRKAQENHQANAGNRDLTRVAFRERLQQERRGNRR